MGGQIIVIGAGAAGLSAALSLADKNIKVLLVSDQPSERAQSVMAEGGGNLVPVPKQCIQKSQASHLFNQYIAIYFNRGRISGDNAKYIFYTN